MFEPISNSETYFISRQPVISTALFYLWKQSAVSS